MRKTVYTLKKRSAIIRAYQSGESLYLIAKRVKTCEVTLRKNLREWGVYLAQHKILNAESIRFTPKQKKIAKRLLKSGERTKTIGRILGIKERVASVLLKRLGYRFVRDADKQKGYVRRYLAKIKRTGRLPRFMTPEYIREKSRISKRRNRDRISAQSKIYYKANRQKIFAKVRHRRKIDLPFRITCNLRNRVYQFMLGIKRSSRTMELVGCSAEELIKHLESQFKTVTLDNGDSFTMNWDNYGRHGWHIDHVKPCATFDLTDPEQQKVCFHHTNLRPLHWKDNTSRKFNDFLPYNGKPVSI